MKSSTKPIYVPGGYSANARTVTNIPNLLTNDIKGENPWYIPKDCATTTTKFVLAAKKSHIAKIGTLQELQTPLKAYADQQEPRNSVKLLEKPLQSHIKEHSRKIKGDKKMKHRTPAPGSGVSFSRSHIARAMRGRIMNLPNFPALNNQPDISQSDWQSELIIPLPTAFTSALQQVQPAASTARQNKCSFDRN